jgi:hypothetical protein
MLPLYLAKTQFFAGLHVDSTSSKLTASHRTPKQCPEHCPEIDVLSCRDLNIGAQNKEKNPPNRRSSPSEQQGIECFLEKEATIQVRILLRTRIAARGRQRGRRGRRSGRGGIGMDGYHQREARASGIFRGGDSDPLRQAPSCSATFRSPMQPVRL